MMVLRDKPSRLIIGKPKVFGKPRAWGLCSGLSRKLHTTGESKLPDRKDRTPDVQFYDWNPKRWLDSDARHELDPISRSIYRDCLDLCYLHGSIPKNLHVLASKCLVTDEQMEASWPKLSRHFHAHKHDETQLVNKFSDIWRHQYLVYVKGQRLRRKAGIEKAKREKELRNAGSTLVQPPFNGGRSELDTTLTLPRHELDLDTNKKLVVPVSAHEFPDFVKACEYAELSYSPDDLKQAKPTFDFLDPDQKRECCEGLRARKDAGEYDEAQFRPLPQNYVREKRWKRPIRERRAAPKSKLDRIMERI